MYLPYQKASYLAPINDVHHLYAVLNSPCGQNQCLVVNVTSVKDGKYYDNACVLNEGDHPFIRHQSYLLYRMADTMGAAKITRYVNLKHYVTREDWGDEVFARIVNGLAASEDVPLRILKYARDTGII